MNSGSSIERMSTFVDRRSASQNNPLSAQADNGTFTDPEFIPGGRGCTISGATVLSLAATVSERVALGELFRLTPAWPELMALLLAPPMIDMVPNFVQQNVLQREPL